jgi:HD-like signal output (HDOD) protein/prolyl-tRNA editing enzyme YbaK/EbsC (Cys-tRNA(Pro) deacylase)
MELAQSLQRYLDNRNIPYSVHPHTFETSLSTLCDEMGISAEQMAVPIVLRTERQAFLMAILPLNHSLDFARLTALLRREFVNLDEAELSSWFLDSEPGAEPAVAEPYNLPCIIDRTLFEHARVYMRAGSHQCLISMDNEAIQNLYKNFPKAVISNPAPVRSPITHDPKTITAIYDELDKLQRLPAMPALAMKLLQQTMNPDCQVAALAETIELDPSVSTQILRYASSPYFGYRGRIDSVQDAITRVLGIEMVRNIALGIASSKAFDVPQNGPLGIKAYWKHALYSAVVAQSLAKKMNRPSLINPSKAYLCGLLHNLGVLLVGHLFPQAFKLLNHEVARCPQSALHDIERDLVIGGDSQQFIRLGHDHIGGYLLERWRLPEEVIATAYFHHDENYVGDHQDYVRLIQLTNHLLAERGIGDGGMAAGYPRLAADGLIEFSKAERVFDEVMEMCFEIDNLADYIAA